MCAAPLSVQIEVINHLMSLAAKRPLYPLELMKLKKAAQAILEADPARAHSVFGVIACLQGNEELMRREHELSISLSPGLPEVHSNYARSLVEFGHADEAIAHQLRAVELAPELVNALDALLLFAYSADAREVLARWLPEYRMRTGVPHSVETWLAEDAEDVETLDGDDTRDEACVSWDELKAELGL